MTEHIPWYKSDIQKVQVVAFISALTAFTGFAADFDWNAIITGIFGTVALLAPVVTYLIRKFRPSPNLSDAADEKEIELVNAKKIPLSSASVSAAEAVGAVTVK